MEDRMEKVEIHKPLTQVDLGKTMGEFLAGYVHKLNNSLAAIAGYSQLLLPKVEDPTAREEASKILEETERMSQVIRNLSSFIRRREPRKEPVDLNALISTALESRTRELEIRGIRVVRDLSPYLPVIQADPRQIQQVIRNLVNNSEEAILRFHGFGEIAVKTHAREEQVEVIVSDDGPGIGEEDFPKIFTPFFTTKENGAGLGLAISCEIVGRHGGMIEAESEWGKGTSLSIRLPILSGNGKRPRKTKGRKGGLDGTRGLLIDDEPAFLNLVLKYLKREGCEIVSVTDVNAALKILGEGEFDFILCDMKMPGMGGDDFYRILSEKKPSLKGRIIFSSGDLLSASTDTFLTSTGNPYVEKPFDLKELKAVILELLETENPADSEHLF
jgi:CheY-like chemotaxis protein